MSINMDTPKTILEQLDALTNLVEQMYMAHLLYDEANFIRAHNEASKLGFELMRLVEEEEHDRH